LYVRLSGQPATVKGLRSGVAGERQGAAFVASLREGARCHPHHKNQQQYSELCSHGLLLIVDLRGGEQKSGQQLTEIREKFESTGDPTEIRLITDRRKSTPRVLGTLHRLAQVGNRRE